MSVLQKFTIFLAELIGTALLLYLGCFGCIKTEIFDNSLLQMSLNFGLVVMVVVQIFGHVSGAHINPAVSVGAYILEQISLTMLPVYVIAQILGAFIGYGLLKVTIPANILQPPGAENGVCVTFPYAELNFAQAVAIEFAVTSGLVLVCAAVWDRRNAGNSDSTSIRIGLAIACFSLTGGYYTGASMNPARSLAPAIWNNYYRHHWIYWLGPLLAAVVSGYGYKYVCWPRMHNKQRQDE